MITRTVRGILGEMTGTCDIPPLMTGVARLPVVGQPADKKKFKSSSIKKNKKSWSNLHEDENDAETEDKPGAVSTSIIPDDAKLIDNDDDNDNGNNEIDAKASENTIAEPLLGTDLAIVAPDATPNAIMPLNPNQFLKRAQVQSQSSFVPMQRQEVDKKPAVNNQDAAKAESMIKQLGIAPNAGAYGIKHDILHEGTPMPDPVVDQAAATRRAVAAMKLFL